LSSVRLMDRTPR